MSSSRTQNAINNIKSGVVVQVVNKLMAFVVRTVFIRILNSEYLGVNGLFTNILQLLSFTELGIGTAIVFNMYKPIAENDVEKIKSLTKLYRICYLVIGITIFLLGCALIPFLKYLIKEVPSIVENITIIYILFLFNTSISYFFSYKKSVISAYQQESIINRIDSIIYLIRSVFEILFLMLTKNYIVFLLIQIGFVIIENIYVSHVANLKYPFLKEKNVVKLDAIERKSIFSNVKALVLYKMGVSILSGTDNIIISAIINVTTVGICSNYVLIIDSIKNMVISVLNGITASIGNLNVMADIKRKEEVLFDLTLVTSWIFGFCSIALIVLLNPFINLWLGKEFVLPVIVPISLALSFFILRTKESSIYF